MVRLLDSLRDDTNELRDTPKNIANEEFIMNIFSVYKSEIPPFKEHTQHICTQKNRH